MNNFEPRELFPAELLEGLRYILDDLDRNESSEDVREDRLPTAKYVKAALEDYGYAITLSQGEEIYSKYSFNKQASWICDGCQSIESAKVMLKEFCEDILFGENHIGYGN